MIYAYIYDTSYIYDISYIQFRNYSKLTSSKHPFDVTPICAYINPSNLRNILIRSNFPHTVTSTCNK